MFGFLYAPSPGCGAAMRSVYQRTFCGLACRLHADYTAAARFLVNRDSTFLALVGNAIGEQGVPLETRTCCNPLSNPREVCADDAVMRYAAAVTVSGLMVKLDDNTQDEGGLKKGASVMMARLLSPARDRAIGTLNSSGFPTQQVMESLAEQDMLEGERAGLMGSSGPTARAYGKIFEHLGVLRGVPGADLFLLGSSLGRLIYWKDALDDRVADEKRGRYNPLRYHDDVELEPLVREQFAQLQSAVDVLPWQRDGDAVRSVVNHSLAHHQQMASRANGSSGSARRKKKKSDSFWDACFVSDCCPSCDCGDGCDCANSGDGCCDCGCGNCDCCPCN